MKPKLPLTLERVISRFLLYAESRRFSPNTIALYSHVYQRLVEHIEPETAFVEIEQEDLEAFLASFPELSNASICNYHVALASLWSWAVEQQIVKDNLLHHIARAKPEQRVIKPFTEAEVRSLLAACGRSRAYTRPGKRKCDHARPTAARDRAIILTLLDTGLRATELCNLRIADLDQKNRELIAFGKGSKERRLPLDPRTLQAILRYLDTRADPERTDLPLFATENETALCRQNLRRLLERVGERAGVEGVHPHRFRHTFAIAFLRNSGDIYSLQRMMGHSTLTMVQRYLALAQSDVTQAHRRASPVANWHL